LNPRQETPPVPSSALGAGRFIIDTDANTVTYRITYGGLSSAETAAHIHGVAAQGAPAGVLVGLPAGNPKVGVWNYLEAQEADILAGRTYANIHTVNFGGGELRGQIVQFNALLDAKQEAPSNLSTATGWATALVDTATNTINYYLFHENLTGAPVNAHFHGNANYGTSSGVKVGIAFGASPMTGSVNYLEADEPALFAGRWYLNLHTAANPGGEIRGQFVNTVIPIDATQEVPAVGSPTASGFALVAIDTLTNTLGFDERVVQLGGAETAAHIHGFAGPTGNAGVLFGQAVGAQKLGTWAYGAAVEDSLRAGRTYFNVHSTTFPGGEMRGQITGLPIAAPPAVLGVGPGGPRLTGGLAAAPNPFGARTTLSFQLARTGSVALSIVGVDGRIVRGVPATMYAPGAHTFEWDGLDDAGRAAAPGVYFAVIRTPEGKSTTRIARLR
ncbi:MAG: CHRD domain-containing protein, partial [Candidatus Eisenbacteria bacterium]